MKVYRYGGFATQHTITVKAENEADAIAQITPQTKHKDPTQVRNALKEETPFGWRFLHGQRDRI